MTALSREVVLRYLVERGTLAPGVKATVKELGGGVSCLVLGVVAEDGTRLVIKQALPQLRVGDMWTATPRRAVTEADALRLAAGLTPGAVPQVLDSDPDAHTVTVAHAPDGWRDWKSRLLAGDISPGVAGWLGGVLAAWHSRTVGDAAVAARFDHVEVFEQLRIGPYHRTVADRHPELAGPVAEVIVSLYAGRRCLIHGDFSPKNVLVGQDGCWVIDFEVAQYGDPCFDVAFMLNHLFLKAIHRAGDADRYQEASMGFHHAYETAVAPEARTDMTTLMRQTGCLMLARVDGKSPAEYLGEAERGRAWRAGSSLLLEPPGSLPEAWLRIRREQAS